MISALAGSCSLIRKTRNASTIRFASQNVELIEECAKKAITISLEQNLNSFSIKYITDRISNKKVESMGSYVNIVYASRDNYGSMDSTVTFKTISFLMGVTEIVYDFAYNSRSFENEGKPTGDYYFVKVADRIYYRKRLFPMM